MEQPFCPQCEIRRQQTAMTAEHILQSAQAMKAVPGVTTPDDEYRRRLTVCESCPSLSAGVLCAECGSYTAYRARLLRATCPYPSGSRW